VLALALLVGACPSAWSADRNDGWVTREVRRFRTYPHLDRAYRLLESGRLAEARAELERCLAIDPSDAQARSSLLVVLGRLGDHAAVVVAADAWLRDDPAALDALRARASARQALGLRAEALGDLHALSSRPEVAEPERRALLASIAETALALARDADALAALDRLPRAARDHRYFMRRGLALEHLGRASESEQAYAGAFAGAAGAGQRLDAARALVESAARRGAWSDAVRWSREILAAPGLTADERYRTSLMAGHAFAALSRWPSAVSSFRAAAEVRPSVEALAGAAAALERQGRTAEAIADLQRASGGRADAALQLRLGVLYARDGRPEAAIPQLEAALRGGLDAGPRAIAQDELRLAWRALAQAEARRGEAAAAAAILERLLADEALDPRTARDLLLELGHLHAARGLHVEAAEVFLVAAELEGGAAALVAAAESLALASDWAEALRVDRRLLALNGLPGRTRADAFARLATAHARLGQPSPAADAWAEAIALGRDGWQERLERAGQLYAAGKWSDALAEAQASLAQRRTAEGLRYAARSLERLDRPGLALHYLRDSMALGEPMDAAAQAQLQRELCFLYEQQADHARALEACERAAVAAEGAELQLRLIRLQRLAGRGAAARRTLEALDLLALSPALRAAAFDERAALDEADGRGAEALEALRRSCALEETAERRYRLGLALRQAGDLAGAEASLAAAVKADPGAARYREALGYTQLALQRDAEATRLLEPVAEHDPDFLELPRDLAYAQLRQARNAEAQRWFAVAIDNAPLYPVRTADDEAALRRDVFQLRQEMTRLRNRYDLVGYASLRSSSVPSEAAPGALGAAGLPSEAGVEFSWQPPGIGFRAERTFQVFARLLGAVPEEQQGASDLAAQGGLGLRWKPLRRHDFTLWAERLVPLGEGSTSDWMLRGIYSWTRGAGAEPGRGSWGYTLLQGDAAHFVSGRSTALYGEARQGLTLGLRDGLLLTPHVVLDGRREWAPAGDTWWGEAGAGLSLKLLFRDTRHEAHRSSFELRVYHKRGRVFDPAAGSRSFQGWVAATAVKL
jgi:bacteriophage N4 adsorption protein A